MNKNKKILLIIVTLLMSTMLFANKVMADQVMALKCNMTKSTYSEENIIYKVNFRDVTGEQIIAIFTDKDGIRYLNTIENAEYWITEAFNTIPDLVWYKGVSLTNYAKADDEQKAKYLYSISPFKEGKCPKYEKILNSTNNLYFFDESTPIDETAQLSEQKYIIYSYEDGGEVKKIAEAYTNNGTYAYIGPDLKKTIADEVTTHQVKLIKNVGYKEYFNVNENYNSLIIAGNGLTTSNYAVCEGKNKNWCENNKKFTVLISNSQTGKLQLKQDIADWFDNEIKNGSLKQYNDIMALTSDEEFMTVLSSINEKILKNEDYDFENVNLNSFIDKLENGTLALRKAYSADFVDCGYTGTTTSAISSITSCLVYSEKLKVKSLVELAEKQSTQNMINQGQIISMIYSDVKEMSTEVLKEKNYDVDVLDSSDNLAEYTELMYTAIAYLKSRANRLGLDEERIKNIYNEYSTLVEEKNLNIYPVVDCETLLGEDLINKIKGYIKIIKIIIPIIVIGFGIVDFTKAMFAGEDDMKKAQKQFLKRLVIAILIFLTPTLLDLLLSLANKVWTIISPDSCGIF